MAQLKDLIVNGASRFIGDIFGTTAQLTTLEAPTSDGETTYGPGSNGQVLKTNGSTLYWADDNNSGGTVTSVRVQATSPVVSSVDTAQAGTLDTTISLANGYGDIKNPYGSKVKNQVLASPSTSKGAPSFRALDEEDIPTLSITGKTSGTLTVARGGTGKTSWTKWGVVYASASTTLANTAAGTSGQVLQSNGSSAPSWITATNSNTASTIVKRDASGNFSAGTITASLSGNAATATAANLTTTDNAIARYDGTAGKFANSGVTIDDYNNLTAKQFYIFGTKDSDKTTRYFTSDTLDNIYASVNGSISFLINDTEVRSGTSKKGVINLGTSAVRWKNVYSLAENLMSTYTAITSGRGDLGSGNSPRYLPYKWHASLGFDPADGDIIVVKMPSAGNTAGVWLSTNGDTDAEYHPIAISGSDRLTTHFASGTILMLVYQSSMSVSTYALAGADSTASVTGLWRVLNYYNTNTNTLVRTYKATNNINLPILMTNGSASTTATNGSMTTYADRYAAIASTNSPTINPSTGVLRGAAWNDYAEYRKSKDCIEIEAGRVVKENGDGTLSIATKRLERGCEIVSDTYGFAIGENEEQGITLPTAAAGRVLAYPDADPSTFEIGAPVCSGENGTVSMMTEEEEMHYPSRIIGTVSEIPTYKVWHGGKDIQVNGRIWIRIR